VKLLLHQLYSIFPGLWQRRRRIVAGKQESEVSLISPDSFIFWVFELQNRENDKEPGAMLETPSRDFLRISGDRAFFYLGTLKQSRKRISSIPTSCGISFFTSVF